VIGLILLVIGGIAAIVASRRESKIWEE